MSPELLKKLRRAILLDDVDTALEIISDYLAEKGLDAWWEGLVLCTYASEARDVIVALKELFAAAQIPADIVAWPSGGFGPVKIGLNLPWGERA
jgi:hypothetical protein